MPGKSAGREISLAGPEVLPIAGAPRWLMSVTPGVGIALQIRPPEGRSCPHRDVAPVKRWCCSIDGAVLGEVEPTLDPPLAGVPSSASGVSRVDSLST